MLRKLGLKENWIYEVLMETGGLHRAPMGIWTEDFDCFIVDVYKDSSTYSNLKTGGVGTVYFVEDPRYFVETKNAEYFAKVDFKVVEVLPGNPSRFTCRVLEVDIIREGTPLNRARGIFLEYLVERSRKAGNEDAKKRYEYYRRTIKKVAPGSVYDSLVDGRRK